MKHFYYLIKIKKPVQKQIIKSKILFLKASINKNRTSFIQTNCHQIRITPYWLLGFIEGDGNFTVVKKTLNLLFSIEQTINEKPVIEAIADFIRKLPGGHQLEFKNRSILVRFTEIYPLRPGR
jgi:hypothetical protein